MCREGETLGLSAVNRMSSSKPSGMDMKIVRVGGMDDSKENNIFQTQQD